MKTLYRELEDEKAWVLEYEKIARNGNNEKIKTKTLGCDIDFPILLGMLKVKDCKTPLHNIDELK